VVGADVSQVRRGIGTDRRIGKHFLFPGVGYGGSCFPKDVRALQRTARENGLNLQVLESVESVNQTQKSLLSSWVIKHFGGDLTGHKIAVWGLAFKAQTDDMREAPSLIIIDELIAAGARIAAFDPQARESAEAIMGDKVSYGATPYDVLSEASALLIVTDWSEFRTPDFERVKDLMNESPVVFDGRNLYERDRMSELGFAYYAMGRGRNPGLG
jgi:UDPglucose 6-dehydrogenase